MQIAFSNEIEVMVPAYGSAPFLFEALQSACENLPQTVRLTVVEDPSESADIELTVGHFGDRVGYLRLPARAGISGVFNACAQEAQANYVVLLGHDDLVEPDFAKIYLDAIRRFRHPAVVLPQVRVIDSRGKNVHATREIVKALLRPRNERMLSGKKFIVAFASGNWTYHPSIAWRVDLVQELGFSAGLSVTQDLDMLIRIALMGEDAVAVHGVTVAYRRHTESASSTLAPSRRLKEELSVQNVLSKAAKERGWRLVSVWSRLALLARISAALPSR